MFTEHADLSDIIIELGVTTEFVRKQYEEFITPLEHGPRKRREEKQVRALVADEERILRRQALDQQVIVEQIRATASVDAVARGERMIARWLEVAKARDDAFLEALGSLLRNLVRLT